jgi:hypothetical protein
VVAHQAGDVGIVLKHKDAGFHADIVAFAPKMMGQGRSGGVRNGNLSSDRKKGRKPW